MKRFYFVMMSVVMILVIVGCSGVNEPKEPQFLNVELTITPEQGQVGENIVFEAKVTYGEENVKNADDVVFEIWRALDEEHERIKVEHSENGIYRLEKSFDREGTYYIFSHVTARDMHAMPKREFVIGEASEKEESSSSKHMESHK